MKKYAVIVAGGAGLRMNSAIPKQFLPLQGRPLLWHTLTAFLTAYDDMQVILVLPSDYREKKHFQPDNLPQSQRLQWVTGGETRFHSVKNGLQLVRDDSVVFVHDGVRCLIKPALIQRCYEAAMAKGNAIPATRVVDSLRMETEQGNAIIDRDKVRVIQTPQTFLSRQILPAFDQPYDISFTDEASVVEKTGISINLIEGDADNIKITRAADMLMAEKILEERTLLY